MHGLINRAVERFARDTYGDAFWGCVTRNAGLGFSSFEAMLTYDSDVTYGVIGSLAAELSRTRNEVLEDIGTYLVASPNTDALRRLLRFGGTDFVEFLNSLDELPARVRLAVPDLPIPRMEVQEKDEQTFSILLNATPETPGLFGPVLVGLLRAMADDYGALVFLNHAPGEEGQDVIEIILLEAAFSEARDFDLGARTG